ncbi:type I site-specific deoxyribonuclease specificity subunit [Halomonas cupida]|uniref:Type I restriction enzyme, S subunit n=1 Tax=Halomonas cupida TaxID=44933 RepID=A0A1M7CTY3_9GAMM|nr:restriction endonuclease subunit S [Halomonas cupida]GEN26093.1 type I site-specific deoxyribonuclease specificity subunit [Halomonas cupida]SHL70319.1 type I restriction enzyme, S subunit [Halomonas cupida]
MKDEKQTLVPRLRFPEFSDEWEYKELKPFLENYSERVDAAGNDFPIYSSTRTGLKFQKDYYDGREVLNEGEYGIVPAGYFVYRHMSDDATFKFNINGTGHRIAVSKEYPVFKTSGLDSRFLLHKLNDGEDFKRFAEAQKKGGTRTRLYFKTLCSWSALFPELPEQKKIADCLSSLDTLIASHTEKLDALKTHKKGLMQQFFPREGESVPRLRFPEFQDAEGWRIRELESLTTKVGSGITPRGGDKNYKSEGRPFIRSQNVGWGELVLDDIVFIDEETHKSFGSTEIKGLDVLLNITGASIGRSAIADLRISSGNVNQHVCIIRTKRRELNPFFLNQFLLSDRGQNQIDSFQAGGNRQGLNFGQIRSFKIPIPSTEVEQQKIADCLSSFDALIIAQSEKIDALKFHKKGLMQHLFPSPEVVV